MNKKQIYARAMKILQVQFEAMMAAILLDLPQVPILITLFCSAFRSCVATLGAPQEECGEEFHNFYVEVASRLAHKIKNALTPPDNNEFNKLYEQAIDESFDKVFGAEQEPVLTLEQEVAAALQQVQSMLNAI